MYSEEPENDENVTMPLSSWQRFAVPLASSLVGLEADKYAHTPRPEAELNFKFAVALVFVLVPDEQKLLMELEPIDESVLQLIAALVLPPVSDALDTIWMDSPLAADAL